VHIDPEPSKEQKSHLSGANFFSPGRECGTEPPLYATANRLFAFGGAGPLHAVEIARELGIPTVLVPRFPGITSGLGCVLAPVRHDFVQSIGQPLANAATTQIDGRFADQAAAGRQLLAEEAFVATLAKNGVPDAAKRVFVSSIPIRS
jgi:N-methylhydantoinase A/oxoprolinase/acetone carboxylase beta subunit